MTGTVIVMRRRGSLGYLPGWIVADEQHHAIVGTYAAALHFATRLTSPPRQEPQPMTTLTTTTNALALERTIALAEHALAIDPDLETAVEDRRAVDAVRDAATDAWLAQ